MQQDKEAKFREEEINPMIAQQPGKHAEAGMMYQQPLQGHGQYQPQPQYNGHQQY